FSKVGYYPVTKSNVKLTSGITKTLDVVMTSTAVSCTIPSGLSADNITDNSADLHWSNESASKYTIKLKNLIDNTTQTLTSTTNSLSVTGLNNCTDYEFKVKSKCPDGSTTNFSAWYTFSTFGNECRIGRNLSADNDATVYPNPFSDDIILQFSVA